MKKKNRKIISLLACFACAVSLAGGVAFACRTAIGAPVFAVAEGNETASAYAAKATNAEIIAGIASNETNRTFEVKGENEEVYATASAGYFSVDRAAENGVSGDLTGYDDPSAQKEFTNYAPTYLTGSNWEWIASTHESDYCWHKNVFLKLEIKKEGYLGLTHPSETRKSDWGDNGHESAIQVVRIREGKVKLLSEEWINNRIEIPENSLLHDAGNVKTGDVVFVASRGRWEPWTYFNPVFTFEETRSEVLELEATNGQILSGIAANTAERRYDVTDSEDKVYATITAGTGTAVTEEKPFDNYSSTHFTSSEGKGDWGQPWIAVGSDANYCWATGFSTKGYGQVYLKAEIKEEAYLSLSHGAVEHQRTDYAGSKVMVMRLREGKTTVLSEKPRGTSGSTAANSLLGDVGNVRKGDVIYVILTGDEWGAQICFDPVFTFTEKKEEPVIGIADTFELTNAIEQIVKDTEDRKATVKNESGETYAEVQLMYGDFKDGKFYDVFEENKISATENTETWISSACWKNQGSVKLTVKEDCNIRFVNGRAIHNGYFNWSMISLTQVRGETQKRLFTTSHVASSEEGSGDVIVEAGKFYDYTVNAKAGDVYYLSLLGNEWGAQLATGLFRAEFSEYSESAIREKVDMGTMMANLAETNGEKFENGPYTSYRILTGTVENPVKFGNYTAAQIFSDAQNTAAVKMDTMIAYPDQAAIFAVDIEKDCDFRFTHEAQSFGSWASGYTLFQIFKKALDGSLIELKNTAVTTWSTNENYYTPDTYEAKSGEVYYFVYRTSNSYYGGTNLTVGYEAAETLEKIPADESFTNSDLFDGEKRLALYDVSFKKIAGETVTEMTKGADSYVAGGSSVTADRVTVGENERIIMTVTAKRNIALKITGTGATKVLLFDGSEVKNYSYLADGDFVEFVFEVTTDYAFELTADSTAYVEESRHTEKPKEIYSLTDIVSQAITRGNVDDVNLRRLSSFKFESGKFYGERTNLLCLDPSNGAFSHPSVSNSGFGVYWDEARGKRGMKWSADTGYDLIVTVTALKDSYFSVTHPAIGSGNKQWALGTFLKAFVEDTDGTAVMLWEKQVKEEYNTEYFKAEAYLKAGQSFVFVYTTPTGLYGSLDFTPDFMFDTERFDAEKVVDFTEARALRVHKETNAEELSEFFATFKEAEYSGINWIEMNKTYQEGYDKILDSLTKEAADTALAESKKKLSSIQTAAQAQEGLATLRQQKLDELKALYESLSEKNYSKENWAKIKGIYENGIKEISNQTTQERIESRFKNAKAAIEAVETDGGASGCGGCNSVAGLGSTALGLGLAAIAVLKRKEKTEN